MVGTKNPSQEILPQGYFDQGLATGQKQSGSPIPLMGRRDSDARKLVLTDTALAGGTTTWGFTWGDPTEVTFPNGGATFSWLLVSANGTKSKSGVGDVGTFDNPPLDISGCYELVVSAALSNACTIIASIFSGADADRLEGSDTEFTQIAVGRDYRFGTAANQGNSFIHQFSVLPSFYFGSAENGTVALRGKIIRDMERMVHVSFSASVAATTVANLAITLSRLR